MIQLTHKSLFIILALFISNKLHANSCCPPYLEVKTDYFLFADKKMRSVYNQGGIDIQLSGSLALWKWLQLYTSIEYLKKEGHSLNANQKTAIWQIPITVGLKACIPLTRNIDYYLTLGPRYFYIHMHNDSSFVNQNLHKNGIGGFLGTGFTIVPCSRFIIDLFGEYSYQRVRFHPQPNVFSRNLQVGGFVFGGGIGYLF